jgi:hypothetical protein
VGAWARLRRSGQVELALALTRTGAAGALAVGGHAVPFDRPPDRWAEGEVYVHRVRLALPGGRSRVQVGSAALTVEVAPFAADFEGGTLDGWSASGTAFSGQPRHFPGRGVEGFDGDRLLDSYFAGDKAVGELRSPPLAQNVDEVCFVIGGGAKPSLTGVALEIDGKRVGAVSGRYDETMREACFSARAPGERRIVVYDRGSDAGDHVLADDFDCAGAGRPVDCAGGARVVDP